MEELANPSFRGIDGVYQSTWERFNTGRIGVICLNANPNLPNPNPKMLSLKLKVQKNVEMTDSKSTMEALFNGCVNDKTAVTGCGDIIKRLKEDYSAMIGSVGSLFKLIDPFLEKVEIENDKRRKELTEAKKLKKQAKQIGAKRSK